MIYTFKCKATGDVQMTGPVASRLLGFIGKPATGQGILQPGELLAAIQALDRAVINEASSLSGVMARAASVETDADDDDANAVGLRQQAWPLIKMMKDARTANAVIVWGV